MKQVILIDGNGVETSPIISNDSFSANIDSTYTNLEYVGEHISIRSHQNFGIKQIPASLMPANMQGMAIYGNILVRTKNATSGHKIFHIDNEYILTELKTFDLDIGHGNALQFAPVIEGNQFLPYLYCAALNGICYVLSIDSSYNVTLVQTITIANVSQVLKGEDGYLYSSTKNSNNSLHFVKYRKVTVAEGDVTLTDADILDSFDTNEVFPPSTYTSQGWKVKMGKIWFSYGTTGTNQQRGIIIYDVASHRRVATLDLTGVANFEEEDIEFFNDSLLLATYSSTVYEIKF